MKIGIMSDSHDDIENVQEAIKIFNKNKMDYVIHAGDYIFPGIIKEFTKLNAKLIGVLGNNDGEKNGILKSFIDVNGELKGEIGEIEIDEIKFGIYHGTDREIKESITRSRKFDILICGHTHKREPQQSGYRNQQRYIYFKSRDCTWKKYQFIGSFFRNWTNNIV